MRDSFCRGQLQSSVLPNKWLRSCNSLCRLTFQEWSTLRATVKDFRLVPSIRLGSSERAGKERFTCGSLDVRASASTHCRFQRRSGSGDSCHYRTNTAARWILVWAMVQHSLRSLLAKEVCAMALSWTPAAPSRLEIKASR